MNPDEVFVGILALSFSLVAFSIGIGPWLAPYRLRTIHGIAQRYGKRQQERSGSLSRLHCWQQDWRSCSECDQAMLVK